MGNEPRPQMSGLAYGWDAVAKTSKNIQKHNDVGKRPACHRKFASLGLNP
jgi:hypothetical protein